jgi:FSR family fosmidomycin resistance protein-like MFS transporter
MSLFRSKLYLAVTLGHFTIDIFNSMGPVLVTFLSVPLALTAAQIGLAVGLYQLLAAVTQPLFGWLTDKVGSRWLGPISIAWTVGFLVLSVLLAQSGSFLLFLIPFCLAAVGSGAFHPQGAMHAASTVTGRAATATAVFFLFGQGGLAGGPVLGGLILDHVGLMGIYLLAFLTLPLLLFIAYAMRDAGAFHSSRPVEKQVFMSGQPLRWGAITLLAVLVGLRSWAFLGTVNFLPKIFQDMGWDATAYGSITGTFWMASAISGVLAGGLADRWGRRQVVFITLLLGSIPLYFLPLYNGWQAFPLAIISGGLLGASHSILVVIAQSLVPGRKAFASGITLGYLFGIGAVAAWGIGELADIWSLGSIIQAGAGIGMLAALLALALPTTRELLQPQPERLPV